jgi:Zn-finger domain-containing protein
MLGKLAKGAKALASDAKHTIVGDAGRSLTHKLNNAIGSDRALYKTPKKFTVNEHDVRRARELENRTKEELAYATAYYEAMTNAVDNRSSTDDLYFQHADEVAKAHLVIESGRLDHQLTMAKAQTQLNAKKRSIAALLEADAHSERMSIIDACTTIDTSAQEV